MVSTDNAKIETSGGFANLAETTLRKLLPEISAGRLTLTLPNGRSVNFSAALPGPHAQIEIKRWRALARLFAGGDIAFASSYSDGDWITSDLVSVLAFGMANEANLSTVTGGSFVSRLASRIHHRLRRNSLSGSRRNIHAHYDLGNDFYSAWLDRGMNYSSAIYPNGNETLEEAQQAKLAKIEEMLSLNGGERVLEIGCGWGALAERLAARGCEVTGLTLSREQKKFAEQRMADAALDDRVRILLQDYRDSGEKYDRVVSIEMMEAVGEEFWPKYFRVIRERLKAGGSAVLQVITIAENRFAAYRARPDFIQRFIFPGGMLPTDTLVREHAETAGLRHAASLNFGDGYARTLQAWRRKFLAAEKILYPMGYDANFRRLWDYYLAYCEAGFASKATDVVLYRFEAR